MSTSNILSNFHESSENKMSTVVDILYSDDSCKFDRNIKCVMHSNKYLICVMKFLNIPI